MGPRLFKLFNAWVHNNECMSIIRNEWGLLGNSNGRDSGKLKKLKGALKKWNGEDRVTLERRLNEIEVRIRCLDDCSDVRELSETELEE